MARLIYTVHNIFLSASLGIAFFLFPLVSFAQQSQVLSVTPPLFQISVEPGDLWQSSVKVVNNNSYPITVYAEVLNFSPEGEAGQGKFVPIFNGGQEGTTLAEWIEVMGGPYTIPPEQTKEVPFILEVPADASPGGHFAAILIGTQPPKTDDVILVKTSQVVTSLFFVRIAGDIVEQANIRQFSVADWFVETPSAEFLLRFENKGNVHIQPRGDIIIYNMWGKERGTIPINKQSHFGNVLPDSIREFSFRWEGERSLADIGRYSAEVVLNYGVDGIKTVDSKTFFWVIPVKAGLITLSLILGFILVIVWAIKLYVRRMLVLAGVDIKESSDSGSLVQKKRTESKAVVITHKKSIFAPLSAGLHDFLERVKKISAVVDVITTLAGFVWSYKTFFLIVALVSVSFVGIVFYISEVSQEERSYEITVVGEDGDTVITSEEILKEEIREKSDPKESSIGDEQYFILELINATGVPGVAAEVAVILEDFGYSVDLVSSDLETVSEQTKIVSTAELSKEVEALSAILGDVVVENFPDEEFISEEKPYIRIVIGLDKQ